MPPPAQGLSQSEAASRLTRDGPNELRQKEPPGAARLLLEQFKSPVIWVLLAACGVSVALGHVFDAIAIGTIVVVNAVIGFFQEYRAERALLALRSLTAPHAKVVRDGAVKQVPAREVVEGDLLVLEAGDLVPADARLCEAHQLAANEATLTGESMPAQKSTAAAAPGAPLAERQDTIFMGTAIATGTGRALVAATGMKTELGRVAHLLATVEETETPLQSRLTRVSQLLLWMCLSIVAVVAVLGLVRGLPWLEVLLSAVSLAVAAVPEGLPAIVTIALAVGVQRMADRHVLIRKLHAVETLGSASVICTDKTGTLTTGQMRVREQWGPDHRRLLEVAACCCDAELSKDERTGLGDPTEVAILLAAAERGLKKADLEQQRPRVKVNSFDSERRMMSVLRQDGTLYLKGAIESVLAHCPAPLPGAAEEAQQMALRGLRVLAVATGKTEKEESLVLVGLIGIADPPRSEAIAALAEARKAGIVTVMITGDHPSTANAIAWEMGLLQPGDDPAERVYARATPEKKLEVVRAWKAKGAVVAMTGDGVNDAPAMREAHIGIAMGKSTEVTREASEIILTDDNYASIVAGVREGRGVFDNIRKTLVYLLPGNFGELVVMLAASLLGWPLPLLPVHLLWVNLVTETLPALALVVDPLEADAMTRPPRPSTEAMLGRSEWRNIFWTGMIQAAVTLSVFAWAYRHTGLDLARDLAFSTLVFGGVFRAFAARSVRYLLWELGLFTNLRLLGVVLATASLQVGLHYLPVTQRLFGLQVLDSDDLIVCLAASLVPATLVELGKVALRLVRRPAAQA